MRHHTVLKKQLLTLLIALYSSVASAELTIQITQGTAGAAPIAILSEPSQYEGANQANFEDIATIVRKDLYSSGRFSPLLSNQMPKNPIQADPTVWQDLAVENLITGRVEPQGGDQYNVHFSLFDVFKMNAPPTIDSAGNLIAKTEHSGVLVTKAYQNISTKRFRALAHHISDVIYERLTGVRGAFSTRIAYVVVNPMGARTQYKLQVADADGHQPHTLLESYEPIMSPSWSPDGRSLAFVSFERKRAEIYLIDVATGKRQLLSLFPGINGAPAWSPDGRKLALVLSKDGSPKIYTLDIATKQLDQITTGYSIDTEPTWTNDGKTLYFTSNRGGKPQVYKADVHTKRIARVTFEGDYNARPKLTPDNKYLVMIHRSPEGVFHIAAQTLSTGEVRILTDSQLDESPSISPNGAMILYGTKEGDRRVLALVTIDGRGRTRLPIQENSAQEPAWSPFSL